MEATIAPTGYLYLETSTLGVKGVDNHYISAVKTFEESNL